MNICVIGLGKLGSPLAAVLASKGHNVIGVDRNDHFVDCINAGKAPVVEPQLQELIDASKGRLRATHSYEDAIPQTDISFVIVPTPSDHSGVFTNAWVIDAVKSIGAALKGRDKYHVVNITSTVMPGSTQGPIREALEAASGKVVGVDIGLCYNPEFIALGSVVRNMLYPDMILLGQSDDRAGDVLEAVYRTSTSNNPPVQRMNLINAEITKISVNTYVTTKISYANTLAELCERLPGADVAVVTEALGKDSRIGSKYLTGALGYGGPCFPRDNVAFSVLAEKLGVRADLPRATDAVNKHQINRLVEKVRNHVGDEQVAVLGLAYKPDTPVIDESQGVSIAHSLALEGHKVAVYDPLAMDNARHVLDYKVRYADSVSDAVDNAGTIIITTPDRSFAELPRLLAGRKNLTIIDCWGMVSASDVACTVIQVGRGDANGKAQAV
jgi:UDPglucose 6-dehydrogenase